MSHLNHMLPDVGSQPLIAPVHDRFISSYPGRYFSGEFNPLKKRTITQQLNIDTRFRDNYTSTPSTNFTVQLPINMKNVITMALNSVEIPQSYFVVQPACDNNYFYFKASSMTEFEIVEISPGNYSASQLADEIQSRIDNIIGGVSVFVEERTNQMVLQSGDVFELDFAKTKSGITIDSAYLNLRLGWIMGFRRAIYAGGLEYLSESMVDVRGSRYFFLSIDDHNDSVNNGFYSAFRSSMLNNNILARLSWREFVPGSVFSRDNLTVVAAPREYFGPVNLTQLRIQLTDEYGRVVDLRGMDFSFCLTLTIQYDI